MPTPPTSSERSTWGWASIRTIFAGCRSVDVHLSHRLRPEGRTRISRPFYQKVKAANVIPDHRRLRSLTSPIHLSRPLPPGAPIGRVHIDAHKTPTPGGVLSGKFTHGAPFRLSVKQACSTPQAQPIQSAFAAARTLHGWLRVLTIVTVMRSSSSRSSPHCASSASSKSARVVGDRRRTSHSTCTAPAPFYSPGIPPAPPRSAASHHVRKPNALLRVCGV